MTDLIKRLGDSFAEQQISATRFLYMEANVTVYISLFVSYRYMV